MSVDIRFLQIIAKLFDWKGSAWSNAKSIDIIMLYDGKTKKINVVCDNFCNETIVTMLKMTYDLLNDVKLDNNLRHIVSYTSTINIDGSFEIYIEDKKTFTASAQKLGSIIESITGKKSDLDQPIIETAKYVFNPVFEHQCSFV